jgi:hypothetical protein
MTTNGVWTQRKNAAIKLQHSGLATVVVYHIRHRVVHHIDMPGSSTSLTPIGGRELRIPASGGAVEPGPDFAEQGRIPSWNRARATWVTQRTVSL